MKHSIKREQSHARMSFAEYENQRSLAEGESNVRATLKHMKLSFHLILTLIVMLTMAQGAMAAIKGSGTADDPYLISSTEDWNTFANNVNNGTSYSGQTVKLNADISVTTMVGTWDNSFNGTFDGGGHTLSVTLNNDSQYGDEDAYYGVAPFRFTNGATIQFLVVTGIVTTSTRKYAAGLIGMTKGGTNTIMNCISSVEIYSTINKWGDKDGTHGGFIGKASGTVIIINSLFNGQLTTTSDNPTINCGGFVGWKDGTLSISNCLYAPNTTIPSGKVAVDDGGSATFSRNDVTPTNSYYTQTLGTAQGTAVGTKTAAQLVAALGSAWKVSSGRAVPNLLLSTKSFTIAHAVGDPNNDYCGTITYDGYDFLIPDANIMQNQRYENRITIRSKQFNSGNEGMVKLYPRISGKVKSLTFSSARVFVNSNVVGTEHYVKIGKSDIWTNSYTEDISSATTLTFNFTNDDGLHLASEDEYLEIRMRNSEPSRNAGLQISGTLTITYEPTEAMESHRHNFSYNAVGNTLTATCAHDDGKECNLESSSYQISTSLIPPQNLIYDDGWNYPAKMSGFENFKSETKATIGSITYIKTDTNEDYGTSKPNATGTYTASVTINADNYPYTLQTSYCVTDYHFVYNNYPQFTTDKSGNYAGNGQTVTITFTPKFGETLTELTVTGATTNYSLSSGITDNNDNTYTFTMPGEDVTIGATFSISEDDFAETGTNEYTIKTANGWGWFCFATNYDLAPDGFSGKVVKLAGNVSSSEMAGKSGHPFKGTFDGQNYTLTFNRTAAEEFCAPFHYINGATISNLHVGGTITGGNYERLGGLVGHSEGNITINNCHVSTQISTTVSGVAFHGGVIAFWYDSNVTCTVTGCVYDGLIYNPSEADATTYCSGFIGNLFGSNMIVTFTDCLSAPAAYGTGKYALGGNCFTFVYPNSDPAYNMTNCYYTSILGNRQGRPAATATVAPGNLGNAPTDHGMVKGYKNGFLYDGNYYTPKYGDAVVEYRFNEWNERADVTINGTNNQGTGINVVGVNITEEVGNIKSVTYNRPFNTAQAATVILPFSYICNGSEGGKFYGFKEVVYNEGLHKWVCTMVEPGEEGSNNVTKLTANTPYVFMPNDATPSNPTMTFPNISSMTGGVVTLQPTTANDGLYDGATTNAAWNFHGTYKGKSWAVASNDYGFAAQSGTEAGGAATVDAGQFVRFTTNAFIKPMRCYLSYVGTDAPAPARGLTRSAAATDDLPQSITVRLVSRSGETTAIGEIDTKTGKMTFDSEAWYTLDGVRLSGKPSTKGIYINNGKKVVIK
jgi:hypothetical protein